MNKMTYCGVSAAIFTVVALAHLTRLINGWSVEIDTMTVPMLMSMVTAETCGPVRQVP